MVSNPTEAYAPTVNRRERAILLTAVLIISICALTYELVVATLSSYLLGDSITQFSFTIGFFLSAMGVGSMLSRRIKRHTLERIGDAIDEIPRHGRGEAWAPHDHRDLTRVAREEQSALSRRVGAPDDPDVTATIQRRFA